MATWSSASSPDLASPTTLKPVVDLTTRRAAVRNGAWSSTTRTLTASPGIPGITDMVPEPCD